MSADRPKSYRFSTEAQWNACLFVQADRDLKRAVGGIRPFPPFGRPGTRYESRGAHAPVVTRAGEVIWSDDRCVMHRLSRCSDEPETCVAPLAISTAARVVATSSGLWVAGDPPESLQRYEEDTLTRLLTVDLPNTHVVDIASDSRHAVLALVERDGAYQVISVDPAGYVGEVVDLKDISHATAFVYLRRSQRFVVLAGSYPQLYWFSEKGGRALFSLPVAAMRSCFTAHTLGSDSRDKVFLAGVEGDEFGRRAYVVIFDGDGNSLGDVLLDPLDAPVTGIAATRDKLLITGPYGLVRFDAAEVVPEGVGQVRCMLMTPVLDSPDREDKRRWLRVEATTSLPQGSTLEISWAATDTPPDRPSAIVTDDSTSASQLVANFFSEPDLHRGRTVFYGAGDAEEESAKTICSAPLFDVRERYLRVCITLTAATGARLPLLSELAVLYPGQTLMEDLPAIYRQDEERPNNFLRALVGVLETTTQGLDARIASMGSQIHPATAQEPWLDFIARWLGVPWDDGLNLEQKQAIVRRGAELAKGRGTRAGLEALLESLIQGKPRRFRVTDATADFGFAVVGGQSCAGSALPAMLGGHTRWRPELDSRAVLGYLRLPCASQLEDGAWQLVGRVHLDVAATAAERKAWEPWLLTVIKEMVPLTARVELRWVTAQALRTNQLDGTMTLEFPLAPRLGTDGITNLARLPERGARLSAPGATVGLRLR